MPYRNIHPTPMLAEGITRWKLLANFFRKPQTVHPPRPLPHIDRDLKAYTEAAPQITWFGHSSYLLQANGFNILVDPVFSGHASPLPMLIKAFPGTNTYGAAEMPKIDLMLLTHDHYDHLDRKAQMTLRSKTARYICPLGLAKYLIKWGIAANSIQEMDWWMEKEINKDLHITAMPARHFSGRGLSNGNTLWVSYLLEFFGYKIYIGGDSGYDDHFAGIGEQFGPIDLAILECGQYNVQWPYIHMLPEEAVQAAVDLRTKWLLGVHWGKFGLAFHDWDEPIKRVLKAAKEKDVSVTTPVIGEALILGQQYPQTHWWENV